MAIKQYEIRLDGAHATNLSLSLLRDLSDLILEGSARSARLAVEGRSIARGGAPSWLAGASDVRLLGLREGSLALDVTAVPLIELVPELPASSSDTTAFDLFLRAAEDAARGLADSELLDSGILQTLVRSRALFARGISRMRVTGSGARLDLTEASTQVFQTLASELPPSQVDRCMAVLDSLTMSNRSCLLRFEDGTSLRGHLVAAIDMEQARGLLGATVVVEGPVYFRASGRPHRMEIDHLASASPKDQVWNRTPSSLERSEPAPPSSGERSALFGQWPGDETDEEIFAALEKLS